MSTRNFFDRKKSQTSGISSPKASASITDETSETVVADPGTPGKYKDKSKTNSLPRMRSPFLGHGSSSRHEKANTLEPGAAPPSAEGGEKSGKSMFSGISKKFSFRNFGSFFGRKQNSGGQTSDSEVDEDDDQKRQNLARTIQHDLNYKACEKELHQLFKDLKDLSQAVTKDNWLASEPPAMLDEEMPLNKLRNVIAACSTIVGGLDSKWQNALVDMSKGPPLDENMLDDMPPVPDQPLPEPSEEEDEAQPSDEMFESNQPKKSVSDFKVMGESSSEETAVGSAATEEVEPTGKTFSEEDEQEIEDAAA